MQILIHEQRCAAIEDARAAEAEQQRKAHKERQQKARLARERQEEEERLGKAIVEAKDEEIELRLEQIRRSQEAQKKQLKKQLAQKHRRIEQKKKRHQRSVSLQRDMLAEMVREKDDAIEAVQRRKEAERRQRAKAAQERAKKVEQQRKLKLKRAEKARQDTLLNLKVRAHRGLLGTLCHSSFSTRRAFVWLSRQAKQQRAESVKERQKREARQRSRVLSEQLKQKHEVERLMERWQNGDKKAEAQILKIFRESGIDAPIEASSSPAPKSVGRKTKKTKKKPRKASRIASQSTQVRLGALLLAACASTNTFCFVLAHPRTLSNCRRNSCHLEWRELPLPVVQSEVGFEQVAVGWCVRIRLALLDGMVI